jgi:hypothetical protein
MQLYPEISLRTVVRYLLMIIEMKFPFDKFYNDVIFAENAVKIECNAEAQCGVPHIYIMSKFYRVIYTRETLIYNRVVKPTGTNIGAFYIIIIIISYLF